MTGVEVLFAGVAVTDFDAAMIWYRRFFGRAPDVPVNDVEAMWQVSTGGWLYVLGGGDRAGKALVTLSVGDLDSAVAELGGRGIAVGPVETIGEAGRKATVLDPDGNQLSLIEVRS